jgi:hypothetical protein
VSSLLSSVIVIYRIAISGRVIKGVISLTSSLGEARLYGVLSGKGILVRDSGKGIVLSKGDSVG